jgi:phage head maturation protease
MRQRSLCVALLADSTPERADNRVTGFRGLAYSGDVVKNHGFAGDMAIDLGSLEMPATEVPILLNHDSNQIVGRAKLSNDGKQLLIEHGIFSEVTAAGKEVSALMAEGHPWALSVGVNGSWAQSDRKKSTKLNGRDLKLDSIISNARLLEVSFVPSGADSNAYAAQLSSRHGITPPSGDDMNELEQAQARITELEAQVATLTGERDTATTALTAAQTALSAAATARRTDQIAALFGADAELTDEQRAAYLAMSDVQFAAVETILTRERVASGNPALFTQQATSGRNESGTAATSTFKAPLGYGVDPERAQLHAKALQFQADHPNTDYFAAVAAVEQGV